MTADNRSRAELLATLSPGQRAQIITSPEEMAALEFDWSLGAAVAPIFDGDPSNTPRSAAGPTGWSSLVVGLERLEPAPSGSGKTCAATRL
jgi:hypothetical protein